MLLGFKRQFEPFVIEGSKTHTIRAIRKYTPIPGEICHCYGDVRQKTMHLLGRWPCVRLQEIRILPQRRDAGAAWDLSIAVDGVRLSHDEAVWFAWRDGFRPDRADDALIAMGYWWVELGRTTVFDRHLIHWDYSRPVEKPRRQSL
ncbi:MAG TPA: hypothetical protein VHY84_27515 [Bryobacteraceae bacterium]|jgi:hypothetical protein|nr:hypothetical protein [Bryobacteraceae bacterium]